MSRTVADRTLALAGVFQATALVEQAAWRGLPENDPDLEATLQSLFKLEPRDTPDVFGGVHRVRAGLRVLLRILAGELREPDSRITRYAVGLLHLARLAQSRPELLQSLRAGIERGSEQHRHFGAFQENVLAGLAELYVNTVGSLHPRIMVSGDESRLHNPRNVDLIRSLLLGGFRAAFLWRQCGGSRWGLLLRRRRYAREAERLLQA